jgi:hypothetical protein
MKYKNGLIEGSSEKVSRTQFAKYNYLIIHIIALFQPLSNIQILFLFII